MPQDLLGRPIGEVLDGGFAGETLLEAYRAALNSAERTEGLEAPGCAGERVDGDRLRLDVAPVEVSGDFERLVLVTVRAEGSRVGWRE